MTREEYLSAVEEQIRCKKVRPMVRRELEDHIQDQRDAYISEGKIGREAEKLAVCQMGDPVETGRALDRIHRPRMEWMLPLMAILLSACGLMIQYLSLTVSGEEMTLLSFLSGTLPVYGIGIMLMIGISFVDYRFLDRIVWPLYLGLLVCAAALSDWMHYDNEQMASPREILWTLFLVLFAVIVYRSRGEGMRGMAKNLGLLLFHCLYMNVMTNFHVYYAVVGACLIMVLAAAVRGLYGGDRERQSLTFLALFGGVPALFIFLCLIWGVLCKGLGVGADSIGNYHVQRLLAWLMPEEYSHSFAFTFLQARDQAGRMSFLGNGDFGLFDDLGPGSDYVVGRLAAWFGWGALLLVILFLAVFLGRMVRDVLAQKNRMGFLIGTGICGLFCLKMVLYVLQNLGIMYSVFSVDMPFLSGQPHSVILHFALLGLLMAVYRNTMTAPEIGGTRRRLRFRVALETENVR